MTEIDDRPVTAVSPALLREAAQLVIYTQFGSVPMLQRKLQIGLADARIVMDALEACGIVGEARGALPREVLHPEEACDDVLATLPQEPESGSAGARGVRVIEP